jgi:hypothetical protein
VGSVVSKALREQYDAATWAVALRVASSQVINGNVILSPEEAEDLAEVLEGLGLAT